MPPETEIGYRACVELKARFGRSANIRQSRRLERASWLPLCVYGVFSTFKDHAKISDCGAPRRRST